VFLTASSWFDAIRAALRQFLLNNFRNRRGRISRRELFADASINTCVTVLERKPTRARAESSVRFVRFNRRWGDFANGHATNANQGDKALDPVRRIERYEDAYDNEWYRRGSRSISVGKRYTR
jgi:hypothetical protein